MPVQSKVLLNYLLKLIPWVITAIALYGAFNGVDWSLLWNHLGGANIWWLVVAIVLTASSYLMRARRWQLLFPQPNISFLKSAKVLILGFFMNNVLPARAGEIVRAHMGSKVTGDTRTLVLATIAAERLADGVTLSTLFVIFCYHLGDAGLSENLFYVTLLFMAATAGVVLTMLLRSHLLALAQRLHNRINRKASQYALQRFELFLHGLSPLCSRRRFPMLFMWSIAIWLVELSVYVAITRAFDTPLNLPTVVLFLVTVNFSSLIPAAPGGIGVIEAVASAVLISVGVPKELALTMVIAQHSIQYLVVGIPGALLMLTGKSSLKQIQNEQAGAYSSRC